MYQQCGFKTTACYFLKARKAHFRLDYHIQHWQNKISIKGSVHCGATSLSTSNLRKGSTFIIDCVCRCVVVCHLKDKLKVNAQNSVVLSTSSLNTRSSDTHLGRRTLTKGKQELNCDLAKDVTING